MGRYLPVLCLLFFATTLHASQDTIGPFGIQSSGLAGFNTNQSLNGAGVAIGQVEPHRPGTPVIDTAAKSNSTVSPAIVYYYKTDTNFNLTPNSLFNNNSSDPNYNPNGEIDHHPTEVAGVMISNASGTSASTPTGVASGASLYSVGATDTDLETRAAVSTQYLITNVPSLKAINYSFGANFSLETTDGNALLTDFVDWSAKQHNILYVCSGYEGNNNPFPKDNFNGITVGASSKVGGIGQWDRVSTINTYSIDTTYRGFTDIIAPGNTDDSQPFTTGGIDLTDLNNTPVKSAGTSFAAPLVTGTVALLQQYGNQRITHTPNWSNDYQRHEVMKSVLMNSADKINRQDIVTAHGGKIVPSGGFLGQSRTIFMQNSTTLTWLDSPANDDDSNGAGGFIALDRQMGTGQLNASRARTQFAAGEFHSFQASDTYTEVPVVGWDYGQTRPLGTGSFNTYKLNQELPAGSFISITLAYDRTVTKSGSATTYNRNDAFSVSSPSFGAPPGNDQFSDLDLYLLPKDANTIGQAIAQSIDNSGTVDHIFFQVPTDGQYEFWVYQGNDHLMGAAENYAVSWWADGTGLLTSGRGDINQDGHIDANDIHAMQLALSNESSYANSIGITTDYLSLLGDMNGRREVY